LISNDDLFSFFFAPCRRVGDGGLHHFFGYYNKSNWDKGNRLLAAQQTPWMDIYLTPEVKATIGYFDTQDGDRFHAVGETGAWNFQMGSQLQWLDGAPGRKLIYNDRTGDMSARYPGFGAVVVDVDTQERRVLPMPVYGCTQQCLGAVGQLPAPVHHARDHWLQRAGPAFELPLAPADDGIWCMELAKGDSRLLVSYEQLKAFHHVSSMDKAIHWVSHIEINPASSRILFLHRWRTCEG
jgi:hypothetical protein